MTPPPVHLLTVTPDPGSLPLLPPPPTGQRPHLSVGTSLSLASLASLAQLHTLQSLRSVQNLSDVTLSDHSLSLAPPELSRSFSQYVLRAITGKLQVVIVSSYTGITMTRTVVTG